MPEALHFAPEQLKAYRATYAPNATDEQAEIFFTECQRRALIPGVHVVFQLRKASEFSAALQRKVDVQKVTLITTINALRLIAERTGKFKGYGKFIYYYSDTAGEPTIQSNIPLGRVPHAVSVELFRDGWLQPVFAVARYDAYVQTYKSDGKELPTNMWRLRGEEQLAKCAEAGGLRMVAPEECGGLYIAEEFERENHTAETTPETAAAPVVVPQPTVAPAVNQAAATVVPEPETPARIQTTAMPATPVVEPVQAAPAPPAPKPTTAAPAPPKPPVARATPPPAAPKARAVPPPAPAANPPQPASGATANTQAAQNSAPVSAPAPEFQNNRQPAPEQEVRETPQEIAEVADRIARDTYVPPAKPAETETPNPTSAAPSSTAPAAQSAPTDNGDAPATPTEYQAFTQRAAKIVRDKLEKEAKVKGAGALVKDYLLAQSGKTKLQHISVAVFERLISALENATPEDAAKIVKEGK